MNVVLPPALKKFVEQQVKSGRHKDASEVVCDALRLMKRDAIYQVKLKRLRKALAKGEADIAAGRHTILKTDEDIDAYFKNL
jgi:putative addiction module CopG family antidote